VILHLILLLQTGIVIASAGRISSTRYPILCDPDTEYPALYNISNTPSNTYGQFHIVTTPYFFISSFLNSLWIIEQIICTLNSLTDVPMKCSTIHIYDLRVLNLIRGSLLVICACECFVQFGRSIWFWLNLPAFNAFRNCCNRTDSHNAERDTCCCKTPYAVIGLRICFLLKLSLTIITAAYTSVKLTCSLHFL